MCTCLCVGMQAWTHKGQRTTFGYVFTFASCLTQNFVATVKPRVRSMSFWRFSYLLLSSLLKGMKGLQALVLLHLVLMGVLGNQNSSCQAHEASFTHRTILPACIFNCAFSMFKYQYAAIAYMVYIVVSSSTGLIWEWQPVTY